VQIVLSLHHPILSSTATPSSSARTDISPPRRHDPSRIRLKEGIAVTRPRQRDCRKEGVPLVVLLEPLILGTLPISLVLAVMTLLDVPGAASGVCIVLPWVW
jgi:hypothetical protein